MRNINVLVVDDSAIVRKILAQELSRESGIQVIGTALDPYVARDKIVKLKPDVVTLDIEMPRMDGVTFLKKLMRYHPLPVIVVSSLTPKGGRLALEAMESGAVEVLSKPGGPYSVGDMRQQLADKIRAAARARISRRGNGDTAKSTTVEVASYALIETTRKVIAIGASTGGTEALKKVLSQLPRTAPGVVAVQHLPPNLTTAFATRLNRECNIEVKEAEDGDSVLPGRALIAPGNYHMAVRRLGTEKRIALHQGPLENGCRPSADVLFRSIAEIYGKQALGIVLTGMGKDGLVGVRAMKEKGATIIAQDKDSSVAWGMPRSVIEAELADHVLSLDEIAPTVNKMIS